LTLLPEDGIRLTQPWDNHEQVRHMEREWFLTGATRGIGAQIASAVVQAAIAWSQPLAAERVSLVFRNAKTCCA
jgi:hypothetical protein